MYARSPRMETLQVPMNRHPVKIQPMDAISFTMASDDDEECGLGYQNTLVSINKLLLDLYHYFLSFEKVKPFLSTHFSK